MNQKLPQTNHAVKTMWGCTALILLAVIVAISSNTTLVLFVIPCMLTMGAMIWMFVRSGNAGTTSQRARANGHCDPRRRGKRRWLVNRQLARLHPARDPRYVARRSWQPAAMTGRTPTRPHGRAHATDKEPGQSRARGGKGQP
jgi:hypothetical protein